MHESKIMTYFVSLNYITTKQKLLTMNKYTLANMSKDRYSIHEVKQETKTAIIFKAEHLDNETQHLIEIEKDVFSEFFFGQYNKETPQNIIKKGWLFDKGSWDILIDAADTIVKYQKEDYSVTNL